MAIGDSYANATEYMARISKTDTAPENEINLDLAAVSRVIDRKLGMTATGFQKDAADVTRVFLPDPMAPDPRYLSIPPLSAAPTSVKIDSTGDGSFTSETALGLTQITGDVMFLPRDAPDGPESEPFTELFTTAWGSHGGGWPQGQHVEVVGKWGWPALPAAIKTATIQVCGILRLETPRATNQISDIDVVIGTSADAVRILRDLQNAYRSAAIGALF